MLDINLIKENPKLFFTAAIIPTITPITEKIAPIKYIRSMWPNVES